MIRLIIFIISMAIFLIFTIPFQPIFWLLSKTPLRKHTDLLCFRFAQVPFRILSMETGARIKIIGMENIPKDRAVLFAGNHNSYFDIILTYSIMPQLTGFISKDAILKFPSLNVWMILNHCLFLNRDDMRSGVKMIQRAAENIQNGISMFIFPEGTRNKTGDELNMAPLKDGSFKIAEKALCPIIPVAITGSRNIYEAHSPKVRITAEDIIIEFCEPIDMALLEPKQRKHMGAQVTETILTKLREHKEILAKEKA